MADFSLLCKAVLDATNALATARFNEAACSSAWGVAMASVQSCTTAKAAAEQALVDALSGAGLLTVVPNPPTPTPAPPPPAPAATKPPVP